MMAVGGLVVATGVVLVIANRPHTVLPPEAQLTVAPVVTPDVIGLTLIGRR